MYNLMDSNIPYIAVTFCVSLTLVGSFFLLNVILVVLADAHQHVDKNIQLKLDKDVKEFNIAKMRREALIERQKL